MTGSKSHILPALVNILGLPGAGTYIAGRRSTGITQMALSLLLLLTTALPLVPLAISLCAHDPASFLGGSNPEVIGGREIRLLGISLGGMGGYLLNMLWSLGTMRRKTPPPLPATSPD